MAKQWGMVLGIAALLLTAGCSSQVSGPEPTKATVNTTLTAAEKAKGSSYKAKAKEDAAVAKANQAAKKAAKSQKDMTIYNADADVTPSSDPDALWNDDKADRLSELMSSWGDTMNQQYDQYGPSDDVDFYGIEVPSGLKNHEPTVDGKKISIKWAPNGKTDADYALVAIYSDAENEDTEHLYLFTIHDGKGVALVAEKADTTSAGKLNFKATANQDLSSGFADIISGD